MAGPKPTRSFPEGFVPLLDVEDTAYECGVMLGCAWGPALACSARQMPSDPRPWWRAKPLVGLVSRCAPHLPDLYRGMARGAGLPEHRVAAGGPIQESGACTSFAVQPNAALNGWPVSGQTKDTPENRVFRYVVLRLKIDGGPSALTLTYPGWLFGHGFVSGGCAIFRNSLYAGQAEGKLPFAVWGILALHCRSVDEVVEMTRRYGVTVAGHCTVADERGGIAGIEMGSGGLAVLRPKGGIYTHANHVASGPRLRRHEDWDSSQLKCSLHRQSRLRERLEAERGRLTAQSAYTVLCDHANYPASICRHRNPGYNTTAAVVAEPTRGLLHVTRGAPCQNWPRTYKL